MHATTFSMHFRAFSHNFVVAVAVAVSGLRL